MDSTEIAQILMALGCPVDKTDEMAVQLQRRSVQLCHERGGTEEEAVAYLIRLLAGGWSAQARGVRVTE